jgi:hypothetical protein
VESKLKEKHDFSRKLGILEFTLTQRSTNPRLYSTRGAPLQEKMRREREIERETFAKFVCIPVPTSRFPEKPGREGTTVKVGK